MPDRDSEQEGDFAVSEEFVQSPKHREALTGSIDFGGLLQPGLLLHEDLTGGNGGQAWPAGVVLTKYLLRRKRDELKSRSILELGAGGGLVGLAIALGCKPQHAVQITDQKPMLPLMQHNIALNNLSSDRVVAQVYNWGEGSQPPVPAYADVLLAADCVYFEPAFPLLEQSLHILIGPSTTCYFCFKKRRRADMRFIRTIKKHFLVEEVLDDPDHDNYTRESIYLYDDALCMLRLEINRVER